MGGEIGDVVSGGTYWGYAIWPWASRTRVTTCPWWNPLSSRRGISLDDVDARVEFKACWLFMADSILRTEGSSLAAEYVGDKGAS